MKWKYFFVTLTFLLLFYVCSSQKIIESNEYYACTRPTASNDFKNCISDSYFFRSNSATCEYCNQEIKVKCSKYKTWSTAVSLPPCNTKNMTQELPSSSSRSCPGNTFMPFASCPRLHNVTSVPMGTKEYCACLRTCEEFVVQCKNNGIWDIKYNRSNLRDICIKDPVKVIDGATQVSYSKGKYTYQCQNGYNLFHSNKEKIDITCKNGRIIGLIPFCIKSEPITQPINPVPKITTKMTTKKPITTTTKSTMLTLLKSIVKKTINSTQPTPVIAMTTKMTTEKPITTTIKSTVLTQLKRIEEPINSTQPTLVTKITTKTTTKKPVHKTTMKSTVSNVSTTQTSVTEVVTAEISSNSPTILEIVFGCTTIIFGVISIYFCFHWIKNKFNKNNNDNNSYIYEMEVQSIPAPRLERTGQSLAHVANNEPSTSSTNPQYVDILEGPIKYDYVDFDLMKKLKKHRNFLGCKSDSNVPDKKSLKNEDFQTEYENVLISKERSEPDFENAGYENIEELGLSARLPQRKL